MTKVNRLGVCEDRGKPWLLELAMYMKFHIETGCWR